MFYQFNDIKEFKNNNLIKKYEHDAGWDIRSEREVFLRGGQAAIIITGLHIIMPKGFVGIIKSRSGLAIDNSIEASNAGVLDSGYTGQIYIKIYNHSLRSFTIKKGTRIAQILFGYSHTVAPDRLGHIDIPQTIPELTEDEFRAIKSRRGENGVGSTGLE